MSGPSIQDNSAIQGDFQTLLGLLQEEIGVLTRLHLLEGQQRTAIAEVQMEKHLKLIEEVEVQAMRLQSLIARIFRLSQKLGISGVEGAALDPRLPREELADLLRLKDMVVAEAWAAAQENIGLASLSARLVELTATRRDFLLFLAGRDRYDSSGLAVTGPSYGSSFLAEA